MDDPQKEVERFGATLSTPSPQGVERLSDATILRVIAARERVLGFTRYAEWIEGGCIPSKSQEWEYPQEKIDDIRFYVTALSSLPLLSEGDGARDPDLGKIGPGHVCKHGIRWPHPCQPCDDAAWNARQKDPQP